MPPRHAVLSLRHAFAHPGPSACKALPYIFPAKPSLHVKHFPQLPRLSQQHPLAPSLVLPGSSGVDGGFLGPCQEETTATALLGCPLFLPVQAGLDGLEIPSYPCPPLLWSQQKPSVQCPGQPEIEAHPIQALLHCPTLQPCLPGLRIQCFIFKPLVGLGLRESA